MRTSEWSEIADDIASTIVPTEKWVLLSDGTSQRLSEWLDENIPNELDLGDDDTVSDEFREALTRAMCEPIEDA